MRSKFALAADTFLAALCAFLLVFSLIRYYFHSVVTAVISGIVGGVALGTAAYFYIRGKQRKQILYGREAEEKARLAMHLCLLSESKALALILKITDGIVKGKHIENDTAIYFPEFKAEPCNMDDILPALRYGTEKQKVIICNYIADNAQKLADECGVTVWNCAEVYKKLKKAEAMPEIFLYAKPAKVKLLKRIRQHFTRKLCLPAFWSGAALIFMSWFTFYPIYYIISGSILLVICACAAIFGQPKSI